MSSLPEAEKNLGMPQATASVVRSILALRTRRNRTRCTKSAGKLNYSYQTADSDHIKTTRGLIYVF